MTIMIIDKSGGKNKDSRLGFAIPSGGKIKMVPCIMKIKLKQ